MSWTRCCNSSFPRHPAQGWGKVGIALQAAKAAPCIISLDELDALVPARGSTGGGTDQIYASVVSTMLALMDGIADRGEVRDVTVTFGMQLQGSKDEAGKQYRSLVSC